MISTNGGSALDETNELALTAVSDYSYVDPTPAGGLFFDDSYDDYEDDDFEEEEPSVPWHGGLIVSWPPQ